MWELRRMSKISPKRSATAIAIGLGIALLGFGAAAITYHQAYIMPESLQEYPEHLDRWVEQAKVRMIIGLVGTGIFAFGLLLSRSPDLEFEEPMVYRRPIWHGVLVMALGVSIFLCGVHRWPLHVGKKRTLDRVSLRRTIWRTGQTQGVMVDCGHGRTTKVFLGAPSFTMIEENHARVRRPKRASGEHRP
jgi:hypothetical protein